MRKLDPLSEAKIDLAGQCIICPTGGSFPEICEIHQKQVFESLVNKSDFTKAKGRGWAFKIALGAGVGFTGALAGLAVLPAFGAKAILGHLIGYQIAGGVTLAGAGTNVALHMHKKPQQFDHNGKKPGERFRNKYYKLPYSLSDKRRKIHDPENQYI